MPSFHSVRFSFCTKHKSHKQKQPHCHLLQKECAVTRPQSVQIYTVTLKIQSVHQRTTGPLYKSIEIDVP